MPTPPVASCAVRDDNGQSLLKHIQVMENRVSRMPSQVNSSVAVSIADSDIQSLSAPRVQGQVTGKPHGRLNPVQLLLLRQTVRGAVRHRHCRIEQKYSVCGLVVCRVHLPAESRAVLLRLIQHIRRSLSVQQAQIIGACHVTHGIDNAHAAAVQHRLRVGLRTSGKQTQSKQGGKAKLPPRGQMPSYSGNYTVPPGSSMRRFFGFSGRRNRIIFLPMTATTTARSCSASASAASRAVQSAVSSTDSLISSRASSASETVAIRFSVRPPLPICVTGLISAARLRRK